MSEKKIVRRRKPCGYQNELFLMWVNSRGGIEGFLFEAHHGVTRATGKATTIGRYVEDFADGESFKSMVKKDSYKELLVVAPNCDEQTREGLSGLYDSPKVKMLLNKDWDDDPLYPDKWHEVIVLDGRNDMGDTDDEIMDFELRIELQPKKTLWQ